MVFAWWRSKKRAALAEALMPDGWVTLAADRLPFVAALEGDERERFFEQLKVFALEKNWEGAHGLEVTDEMKVVIAGSAARLTRNLAEPRFVDGERDDDDDSRDPVDALDVYDDLVSIIIYPSHYVHRDRTGVVLGEANNQGAMVLSWDAVQRGIANPHDGHDTALHELAHVIDAADGAFDGTPEIEDRGALRAWAAVFSEHYLALRERPHRSPLREYGATNEAEFFAVATETFFEKPRQLKRKSPELYTELSEFYRVDPAGEKR